jgi:hypothetical protein
MKNLLLFGALTVCLNSFGQTNTSSISFDGVDDQVICNNPLENNMSDFTIMFFANFPQLAANIGDGALITDWPAGGATFKIDQWNNNGNNVLRMNLNTSGGSYQLLHSLTNGDYNTWINWSFNFTGSSLLLYKNGVLVETTVGPQGTVSPSGSSILFGQEGNNSAYYTGLLDEIHIWNVVLTEQQIQDYMQCPPIGNETGLIGYWNFEEGTGTTTTDITANGNDGTLNGGVTWSTDVPPYNINCCTPTTATDIQSACDSYTWVDGNTYTTSNNSATYTTSNAAGCDSTVTLDLTINPTPDNSITQNGASLTATQTGATYQWLDCDNFNAPITGEVNQVFFPLSTGNYAVEVTIGDCSSTSECRLVDFTGIDEIESLISVHPNPTKDEVTLSTGAELLGTEFVVTDNAGRIILTDTFKSSKQIVNLTRFDNGVYFIRTDKESPVKIIKQ